MLTSDPWLCRCRFCASLLSFEVSRLSKFSSLGDCGESGTIVLRYVTISSVSGFGVDRSSIKHSSSGIKRRIGCEAGRMFSDSSLSVPKLPVVSEMLCGSFGDGKSLAVM